MEAIGLTLMSNAIRHVTTQKQSTQVSSLEPISCCIRIAMLPLLPHGTKLGFGTVRLKYHLPNLWQGMKRWNTGDSRRDVDRLMKPMIRMISRCDPSRDAYLLAKTKEGLGVLMDTYASDGGTVAYTIRMYCALLQGRIQGQEIDIDEHSTDLYHDLWKSHEITLISQMMEHAYDEDASKAT